MTSKGPLTESCADAGYRRPDAREWCRRSVDICATGVVAAVVAAVVVLPFAALGVAWGAAIVALVTVALVAALTVRHYNRVLLFALRRSPDPTAKADAASLDELFDAFAAQRCTEVHGVRAVVELSAARLSKWVAGSRAGNARHRPLGSASH